MAAVLINPPAKLLGTANAILLGRGRQHFVRDFPGPLSVKCVIEGAGRWQTEDGDFRVDEHALLVLNHEQPYDLTIDGREPVSTCCLFFARGFVESVIQPLAEALDDPVGGSGPVHFVPRLETAATSLQARSGGFTPCGKRTAGWKSSFCSRRGNWWNWTGVHDGRRGAFRPSGLVPAEEIYRRLCRAREFMHAYRDRPLELTEVARAACLSLFHFHRLFRETFRETPHQYLDAAAPRAGLRTCWRARSCRSRRFAWSADSAAWGLSAPCSGASSEPVPENSARFKKYCRAAAI